jgi:hypothetical protein
MDLRKSLQDEIQDEFKQLEKFDPSVDEFKVTIDGLTKLLDRELEFKKLDIQYEENAKNREIENELKLKQMEEDKKDRIIRNVLTGLGIVVPSLLTIWGTKASFKFEQEGIITTSMGKGFIQRLLPKK